ncbi:hydantoinase/oxoprolinase family protein, partial [Agrobacterium tumefaciens]
GWVDAGGSLRVGPKSAGSEPGPVCYGRGGTQPTITDANLLLGRLDPTLNGKIDLDVAAAQKAMDKLAGEIGLSTLATAEGMIRIGCEYMAQAVKKVLVARGRDPRDFVYASFGGAGALAACFVAKSMNIPKVIVPPHAGVASAFGATVMDLRQDIEHFYYSPVKDADLRKVNEILDDLEVRARKELLQQGFANEQEIEIVRSAQMRYVGQSYEVDTPLPSGVLTVDHLPGIESEFHGVHLQEFGVSSDDFAPAFVSFSVTAIGRMDDPPPVEVHYSADDKAALKGRRDVYFDGKWINCDVFEGEALTTHHRIEGPAIIEYDHACTVLPPKTHAHVNAMGALIIEIEA